MKQTINGSDLRRLIISAAASIEIHKQQLNELNVFPVPDGDTGTNMAMTINTAAADLRKLDEPSLEKAVTELGLEATLDFHSAWNDTYYTVMVYQTMQDQFPDLTLFHKPPKQKGLPPLWELDLGLYDSRWACKNRAEIMQPHCPLCGEPLIGGRWVRTTPTEQVLRCRCKEHRRLYMAVTAHKEGLQWQGKAAIYKDAGPIAERYRKTCHKLQEKHSSHQALA